MSDNDAFNRGLQENTYTGNGSDWADWSRGQMMRQEAERRRREQEKEAERMRNPSPLPGYMPAPAAPVSSGSTMSPEQASVLFRFLFRVLTLPIVLLAALMALFAAPLMRLVERAFRSDEHLDLAEAYKAAYKSIYAWAFITILAAFVLYVLGYVAPSIFRIPSRVVLGVVHTITGPETLQFCTLPQILLTLAVVQVPALTAFSVVLRRTSEHKVFAGAHGFARGLATSIALLPITGLLALISFGVLFKLANTVFHFA